MSTALARACAALELPVQSIWSTLASRRKDESPRRILFASARHGDGTTILAACTAVALCQNLRARVALVEANPFSPGLAAYAECPPEPGFAEVLRAEAAGDKALREFSEAGLSLLPGGSLGATESVDWRGPNVRLLLEDTLRAFPFALVDAPPLLDRPLSRLLLEHVDLAVLVVRGGVTTKRDARAALKVLTDAGLPLAGVILNRFKRPLSFR